MTDITLNNGRLSIDAQGNVWAYVPPNMVPVITGSTVSYGPVQDIAIGAPLNPGIWRVINAGLVAQSDVQVQSVVITPGSGNVL